MRKIVLILLVPVFILSGCFSRGEKDTTTTFLTLKGPSAMGMIELIDHPDDILPEPMKIEILDEPMLVRAKILKEKPELAVLPLNMAAILYNMGLPYQVIGIPVWGTLYLVGQDTSIRDWQALKNRRVFMMGKGTTPDILFRYLLNYHNLIPDQDVFLDYSFPTHIDLANAVVAGQTELAVLSEPQVSMAQNLSPSVFQIMDLNLEWEKSSPGHQPMPQTAFIGRTDFIRDHPEWIKKICDAWVRSIEMVNQNPERSSAMIVSYQILPDSAVCVTSIPRSHLNFRYASEIRSEIGQYLQVFFTFNPDAVGGKLPDEKFICQKPDY